MVGGCCVCSDERGWAENPLVYCDGHACSVAVHQGTGGGPRGAAGPRGRRAQGAGGPRPPETSLGLGAPPPPHLKEREALGVSPLPVLEDRVRHCFLAYCSSPAPPTPS